MTRKLPSFVLLLGLLVALSAAQASFVSHPEALSFVQEMEERHGFDRSELLDALHRASHNERVIRLIQPPSQPSARSWRNYRQRFMGEPRISSGVSFWVRYEDSLREASRIYGVPPEIIVSILGVETHYGSYTGSFEAVSALATLAFDYPRRAELFRRELENLFLLAREQGRDPFSYRGSFAGALGYPQFLPSSIRNYAVDFNGDGRIDFDSDPIDAIGSIANFLAAHGWQEGEPIAQRIRIPADIDPRPLIEAGIEPSLEYFSLISSGISAYDGSQLHPSLATVFDLPTPGEIAQYWVGYRNFYVITRYNRSSFYAMSVFELAEEIRARFERRRQALR
ncbi:lytic murein transglycosylase B [Azoarcus taiwanensis]|uniref:Lytic murein transglycosylase B n=1 Tax=Azoarcus taiwanensis TaxID=666964 RepID=A0A972J979_9RHOO|nr:lytic murein transglycosylase B [Azoarcus taiwanensis]NMG04206.1 lytic murein transglycosylase B [Azoarcus taiwanensis]